MKFYLITTNYKLVPFREKWRELEKNMISNLGQVHISKYHVFSHVWILDLKVYISHEKVEGTVRDTEL